MLRQRVCTVGFIAACLLGVQAVSAQDVPASGLYQIVSGRSIACCGIAGQLIHRLPDASEAFVELKVDVTNHRASMKFLGQDMQSVLRIPPELCRPEFVYVFTNGIVFPDHIRFGEAGVPPLDRRWFSFVVSNSTDTLSINGAVFAPCPGGADFFEEFQHTNVVAVLMPTATIRVSEVEVCWNTASNRVYQVQYRSALTPNAWVNLGAPVAGDGGMKCMPDKVSPGQPQRYYRVVRLP